MSVALRTTRLPLALAARDAASLAWHELPRVAAVSAIVALTWAPLVVLLLAGASAVVPAALALAAVGASALAAVAGALARGERVRFGMLRRVDVVWVALVTLAGTGMLLAAASGDAGGLVVAGGIGAVAALVLPLAAAYGGVRDRRGLAALRGGAIIALARPSVALCVLALGVLCAFGVIATAGVLVLALPAMHAVYAALLAADIVELVNDGSAS